MKNLNLIRKIAWTFTKKTGIEYQELFSEAAVAYVEAAKEFNPERGCKLSTFTYNCMKNHLINFCKGETRFENRNTLYDDMPESMHPTVEETVSIEEVIQEWPEDARKVAQMVLEFPEKYMAATPNYRRYNVGPARRLDKVKKDLRNLGWSNTKIEYAVLEIQTQIGAV